MAIGTGQAKIGWDGSILCTRNASDWFMIAFVLCVY